MLGSATEETFEAVLPHILRDPGIDSVIVLFVPPVVATSADVAEGVVRAVEAAAVPEKPVLGVFVTREGTPAALLREPRRVAPFPYPESAARALARVVERAEWLRRPAGVTPELDAIDVPAARSIVARALEGVADTWLDPAGVRELLSAYGIPVVPERVVGDAEAAVAAAAELGYPVVVKTAKPGAHKTEHGLLALDLHDADEVHEAVARIGVPAIVQPMVRGGAELLAGVVQDPVFGPLVAFGPGGVFAELIGAGAVQDRTDHRRGRRRARHDGQGGTARRRLPRVAAVGRRCARRRRPAAVTARRGPAGGRRARPQPCHRAQEGCVAVDARIRVRRTEPVRIRKTW